MSNENVKKKKSQARLLDRFTKRKPEFKSYKFDLATDLHERLEKLAGETGMSKESINDALNYAVRSLVNRLEREAKQAGGSNSGNAQVSAAGSES
jgi:myo-inositol catabolism protein IolC